MRRRVKLFALIVMIVMMAVFSSGCFFLDFLFGTEEEPDEPSVPEEKKEKEIEEFEDDEDKRETTFYLLDDETDKIVKTTSNIPWVEGIAQETLSKLVRDEENLQYWAEYELEPVIPSGTEIKGMTIDDDGTARVNFSEEFLDYEGEFGQLLNAVVYTLTEFETIDGVEFMVEGQMLEDLPEGAEISGRVGRVGINTEVAVIADGENPVTLYFVAEKGDNTFYVPVTRMVSDEEELEGEALAELINGPDPDSTLNSYVSTEITLNDIELDDGILYLDVSNISTEEGREQEAANQITYTLEEFEAIEKVELTVDGQEPVF